MQPLAVSTVKSPIFCKSKNNKENYKEGGKEVKERRWCNILISVMEVLPINRFLVLIHLCQFTRQCVNK